MNKGTDVWTEDKVPHSNHEAWYGQRFQDKDLGTTTGELSAASVHAEQELQTQGNACVPSQREDTDVARNYRWTQKVLDRRGAVRVPVKHLRREMPVPEFC